MPEAVIVDAIRTPIGRAFKGSMAQLRPDETGAFIVDRLLERNEGVDPASVEEVVAGLRAAPGQAGVQHRPCDRAAVGEAAAGGQRQHRLALLRLGTRRHPDRRQQRGGRAGRHLHRRRRGGRVAVQRAPGGRRRGRPELTPAGQQRRSQRLHPDGRHRGERGQALRGEPGGHGQVRPALSGAGGQGAGGRVLRPRDRPDPRPRGQRGGQGRRPARQLEPGEAVTAARGLRGRRRRDRRQLVPAQRRRRRGADHVGRQGLGAGPEAACPDHHRGHRRQRARVHGRGPDPGRSRRRSSGPA